MCLMPLETGACSCLFIFCAMLYANWFSWHLRTVTMIYSARMCYGSFAHQLFSSNSSTDLKPHPPCQITQNWKANVAPPKPYTASFSTCLYLKGSAGLSVCLVKTMCTGLKDELSPCSRDASFAWCTKQKQKINK